MRNYKLILSIAIAVLGLLYASSSMAQETTEPKASAVSATTDIVSHFVWRGMTITDNINIQQSISYKAGNFTFGAWGGVDINQSFKEIDLYIDYSAGGFSATFTDYYASSTTSKYFDLANESTAHMLELGLSYKNASFPLKVYIGTMFYGADKKMAFDDEETDADAQNYSTYFELSYEKDLNGNQLNFFAGGTTHAGVYGTEFGMVHMGITYSRSLVISDKFSLPIYISFAVNPQTEDIFTYAGISF